MNLKRALEVFELESLDNLSIKGLKDLFKKLAKEKHPDQGGNDKDFVSLKEAHNFLENELAKILSTGTDLKELSKEEILDKYYHDTRELQVKLDDFEINLNNQASELNGIKSEVKKVLDNFETRKEELKKEFEEKISILQKSYKGNVFNRMFFFLPRMSEAQFWERYNMEVQEYSKIYSALDVKFYKTMLSVYGEGLNNIAKRLEKKD